MNTTQSVARPDGTYRVISSAILAVSNANARFSLSPFQLPASKLVYQVDTDTFYRNIDDRLIGSSLAWIQETFNIPTPYAVGNIAGAVTIDYANGTLQKASLTDDVTLAAPSNGGEGKKLELWLTASGADRALDLNAAIKLPSDSAPTLPWTLTSGKKYLVSMTHDGIAWLFISISGGY